MAINMQELPWNSLELGEIVVTGVLSGVLQQ